MFEEIRSSRFFEENFMMHPMAEIYEWLRHIKIKNDVEIKRVSLSDCKPWFLDQNEGCIRNESRSFFEIKGIEEFDKNGIVNAQPIIYQREIGYLGIICCEINGVWHYLMQAKIEPGNVNVVQVSPTLQATKSNFTRAHGGREPDYLKYFIEAKSEDIIVDQIQSEQGLRFYKKRNRNVIVRTKEILKEGMFHRWMTLGQIKELMRVDNLINMDTRTVLSCIPYVLMGQDGDVPFRDKEYFYKTAWNMNRKTIVSLYNSINNYKMYNDTKVRFTPINRLENWIIKEDEILCREEFPFSVIFCDIKIEGREVARWRQPLLASRGRGLFGLFCCDDGGILKFLVRPCSEIGDFDGIEIGPTVQIEPFSRNKKDRVEELFEKKLTNNEGVIIDTVLSEEGGRFYQEENRNVIIQIRSDEINGIDGGYVWSDYGTLNMLTQVNNCLNIQLRNLLSLLEI